MTDIELRRRLRELDAEQLRTGLRTSLRAMERSRQSASRLLRAHGG